MAMAFVVAGGLLIGQLVCTKYNPKWKMACGEDTLRIINLNIKHLRLLQDCFPRSISTKRASVESSEANSGYIYSGRTRFVSVPKLSVPE